MIALRSNPTTPAFQGDKLRELSKRLVDAQKEIRLGTREKHKFDSKVWKKARTQLLAEAHDKCAYCEAPTAVVTYGDIEHYRPKSKYWWQAYSISNYLVSCAICNQRFKKDKFPIDGRKWRAPAVRRNSSQATLSRIIDELVPEPTDPAAVAAFATLHAEEKPRLLNPYFTDPSEVFAWKADPNAEEVELVPIPGDPVSERYVEAAIEIYGLDRRQLRALRYFTFSSYLTHKLTLMDGGISAETRRRNENQVQLMTRDRHPFAGMIRFFESIGGQADWLRGGYLVEAL